MKTPISAASLAELHRRFNNDFTTAATVIISIDQPQCSEERGDNLRIWCKKQCVGRWKQTVRTADVIAFEFEREDDALLFKMVA